MVSLCEAIIKKEKEGSIIYDKTDSMMAKMLIRAIKFINTFDDKAFRLHSKGYGVICVK